MCFFHNIVGPLLTLRWKLEWGFLGFQVTVLKRKVRKLEERELEIHQHYSLQDSVLYGDLHAILGTMLEEPETQGGDFLSVQTTCFLMW